MGIYYYFNHYGLINSFCFIREVSKYYVLYIDMHVCSVKIEENGCFDEFSSVRESCTDIY